jgi:hypothetical protein
MDVAKKETEYAGILNVKNSFDKQVEAVNAIVNEADAMNETVLGIK